MFVRDREAGTTERVSIATNGHEGDGASKDPAISARGRFVAFESAAATLVSRDTNGTPDIFVRDRWRRITERVSLGGTSTQGNASSIAPSISADGRLIAFESAASNLVPNDRNGFVDIFVRDRIARTTERVSVATDGAEADHLSANPAISADGRFVTFYSFAANLVPNDRNAQFDIFVHDRERRTTERVSVASDGREANNGSFDPSISARGRFVAFSSGARTLVADDTNGVFDVFVRDRLARRTERVTVAADGGQSNGGNFYAALSADGRFVAFQSNATNLVAGDSNFRSDVFVRDRTSAVTRRVSSGATQSNGHSFVATITGDGCRVSFASEGTNLVPGDTNKQRDVFVARPSC